jgi:hypothetical protein
MSFNFTKLLLLSSLTSPRILPKNAKFRNRKQRFQFHLPQIASNPVNCSCFSRFLPCSNCKRTAVALNLFYIHLYHTFIASPVSFVLASVYFCVGITRTFKNISETAAESATYWLATIYAHGQFPLNFHQSLCVIAIKLA